MIHGSIPSFATFLPLWFMVQYLGHVSAYLAARDRWGRLRPADVSGSAVVVEESHQPTADTVSS